MSVAETGGPPAQSPAGPMLRAMAGVGLLCGLLIVSAFLLTRPTIERNRAEALERAVFEVLPSAQTSRTFSWSESRRFSPLEPQVPADGPVVHAGYADGRLVGIAIEASGMGYQDLIRVLYGYAPEQQAVVGLHVLESRETPGLGTRIETDPAFRANFQRLDVSLTADLDRIANPIEAVKPGEKQSPWEIDGITGATISAKAIADILRHSTEIWIPRIQRELDALQGGV